VDQQEDQERIPEVVCSGGFRLPPLSAFMPTGEQLAELVRKGQEVGE
jgi:hypothetical protein